MTSLYDKKVPKTLLKMQEWFASIITQPIDDESKINPIAPSGASIVNEATRYIIPSPTMAPDKRIEIYNQQYWWRLLGTMHDSFPLVTRLFGYYEFNQTIATPFLKKYPPDHWSLNHLGSRLPQWAQEEYKEKDRSLILEAIEVEWAFNDSFFSGELNTKDFLKATKEGENSSLLEEKVYLQPHVHLFELKHDLFSFRDKMLQEDVEYWGNNDFPPMKKNKLFHFVLYRKQNGHVVWKEISRNAFRLLNHFKTGCSLIDACQWLEEQDDDLITEATEHLHLWFQEWTMHRWLGTH